MPPITLMILVTQGIKNGWGGYFDGKKVSVVLIDVNDSANASFKNHKNLDIYISTTTNDSNYNGELHNGRITMYWKNTQWNPNLNRYETYQLQDYYFSWIAAHEFGHALGLKDLYNDEKFSYTPFSIMNSGLKFDGKATNIDYALMLRAKNSGEKQFYSKNLDLLDKYNALYRLK